MRNTFRRPAKLNGVDPRASLTDVLGRIVDHKINRFDELLPWRYAQQSLAEERGGRSPRVRDKLRLSATDRRLDAGLCQPPSVLAREILHATLRVLTGP
jgi:hypothetical protein